MSTSVCLNCSGTLTSVVNSTRHTGLMYILMRCVVWCVMMHICCAYSRIPLLDQCGRQAFYTVNRENVSDCEHAAVDGDYTHTHTHT